MSSYRVLIGLSFLSLLVMRPVPSAGASGAVQGSKAGLSPRAVLARGPLPKNASLYAERKAAANRWAPEAARSIRAGARAPVSFLSWSGLTDENVSPPDPTGAIGPTRYVELVNQLFGIYDRTGALLSSGDLFALAGVPSSDFVFDPQVMWDPQTQRFYYAADDVIGNFTNSRLAFGWSKNASPGNGTTDWCHYTFDYPGDLFPDYPKLGDSQNWILIGNNVFDPPTLNFVRADLMWARKPPAGETCPAAGSFLTGIAQDLRDQTGTQTFTPVPLQAVDNRSSLTDGVILSNDPFDPGEQTFFTRFQVHDGSAGPLIENPGKSIPIPAYAQPAPADQPGLPASIDTLDGRPTQGILARDPRFQSRHTAWIQHTVLGGNGAEVRWYQFDPFFRTVLQSGAATSPSLDIFNGAVSSDRANDGVNTAFGSNMVMGFNTSSSAEFVKLQLLSKLGAGVQSGFVLVVASPGENFDFTCCPGRWGDYAAATPDPAANHAGATGAVWLSGMWNDDSLPLNTDTDWRTQNWAATP